MAIKYLSKCIVCNVDFSSTTNIINDDDGNSLLENFCVYFHVSVEINSFSSNHECFCAKCKQNVVELLNLYEQLMKIQTTVKKVESGITKTILETVQTLTNKNNHNNEHHASSDVIQVVELDQRPDNVGDLYNVTLKDDDLIERQIIVWRNQIGFIRRSIYDRFSPTVRLFKCNKKKMGRKSAIKIKSNKFKKRRKRVKLNKLTTPNKDKPLSEQQLPFSERIQENCNRNQNKEDECFLKGHEQELSPSDLHSDSDFDDDYDGEKEKGEGKDEGVDRENSIQKKKTREYECHVCKLKVGTETSLKRHLKTHESSTSKLGRLRRDLNQHPYDCEFCESTFLNKQDRMNHLQKVHSQEPSNQNNILKCEKCEKTFTKLKLLRRHMVSHSDKRTFVCFKCNKCFKTSHYLTAHLKRHDSIKNFSCNICPGKFKTKASLIFHQETVHEGKRRDFPCSVCSNKFTTSHAVKRHLLTHSQTRNFMCDACGSTFQQNSTLRRHIAEVHLKIPPKTQRKTASQRRKAREAKLQQQQLQQQHEAFSEYIQIPSESNSISPIESDKMKVEINSSSVLHQPTSCSLSTVSIDGQNVTHDIRLVSVSNDSYQSIIPLSTTSVVVHDTNFEIQGISSTIQLENYQLSN